MQWWLKRGAQEYFRTRVDYKILAVPDDKIDQEINSLDDLTEYQKKVIQEFFETYKRLEPNKLVKITGFESKEVAEQSKS
ncbi:MAG TPA: inorganic diphosphatase [Candidatus Pacearchaeota archaeon]|nr:inorganic diphosphatase [Candidatus Pacearchaeota archaeon]HQG09472.1 inorganic diphosphatase [Candidatus Pacearchaeota archaeon]HQH20391.1 inorganic diphosphatase [Candidatus Pacearchaeota archaeon]